MTLEVDAIGNAQIKSYKKRKHNMKYNLAIGMFLSLSGFSAWAAPPALTGQISDSTCGKSHSAMGEMGNNPTKCTLACVKGGADYVFVCGDTVYAIRNQNFAGLAANAGATVELMGDRAGDGKTITVTKVTPSIK